MKMVEITFIKNFSNSNYKEGMKLLKPKTKREKHSVTFSSGDSVFLLKLSLKTEADINRSLNYFVFKGSVDNHVCNSPDSLIRFISLPYFQASYLVAQWHYLQQLF